MRFDRTITVPEEGLCAAGHGMAPLALAGRVERILIPEEALQERVEGLAAEVHAQYAGCAELTLLVALKGAFVFAADLGRALARRGGLEVRYEFIRASAYGKEIKQADERARAVSVTALPADLAGKDVLIVEDLIDQGFTLTALKRRVLAAGVRSARICALLSKRLERPTPAAARNRAALSLNFVGFDVPDRWVAGYGTDAGEDFRALPYIVTVREEHYAAR